MANPQVSTGDVLMLAHTTRGIARVFGITGDHIPQQFSEVDRETQGLADALKLLACTLEEDHVLLQASMQCRQGLHLILAMAQSTLKHLVNFIDRYSMVQRIPVGDGTHADHKVWSHRTLHHWQQLSWTEDGGDISSLRSLLIMHCSTITLTTQALQSHSIPRLESTILPLSSKLKSLRKSRPVNLDVHLQELHYLCLDLTASSRPMLTLDYMEPFSPQILEFDIPEPASPVASQVSDPGLVGHSQLSDLHIGDLISTSSAGPVTPVSPLDELFAPPLSKHFGNASGDGANSLLTTTVEVSEEQSRQWNMLNKALPPITIPSKHESHVESRPQTDLRRQFDLESNHARASGSSQSTQRSQDSATQEHERRQSPTYTHQRPERVGTGTILPMFDRTASILRRRSSMIDPGSSRRLAKHKPTNFRKSLIDPVLSRLQQARSEHESRPRMDERARLSSQRSKDFAAASPDLSLHSESSHHLAPEVHAQGKSLRTDFVNELLTDSVKMFDARARLVCAGSTGHNGNDSGLNKLSDSCRILMVKKKGTDPAGALDWTTSIWIIAEDLSVRLEQSLPPYFTAGSIAPFQDTDMPERIILDMPSSIKHHPATWSDMAASPVESLPVERVAYTFVSSISADAFQSALFGHTLLESFKIDRACVLRSGARGFFREMAGSEEEMCGTQRLRVWKEQGDALPGAPAEQILALAHVLPGFGQGWLKWDFGAIKMSQVRVKSGNAVEIRGLDLSVPGPPNRGFYKTSRNQSQSSLILGPATFDSQFESDGESGRGRPSSSRSMRSSFSAAMRVPQALRPRSRSRSRSISRVRPTISAPVGPAEPLPTPSGLMLVTGTDLSTPFYPANQQTPLSAHFTSRPASSGTLSGHVDPLRSLPPALPRATLEPVLSLSSSSPAQPSIHGKWDNPISPRPVPSTDGSRPSTSRADSQASFGRSGRLHRRSNDALFADFDGPYDSQNDVPPLPTTPSMHSPSPLIVDSARLGAQQTPVSESAAMWTSMPPPNHDRVDSRIFSPPPELARADKDDNRPSSMGRNSLPSLRPPPSPMSQHRESLISSEQSARMTSSGDEIDRAHPQQSSVHLACNQNDQPWTSIPIPSAIDNPSPLAAVIDQDIHIAGSDPPIAVSKNSPSSHFHQKHPTNAQNRRPTTAPSDPARRSRATSPTPALAPTFTPGGGTKSIPGMKIYFSSEPERARFVALLKRIVTAEREREKAHRGRDRPGTSGTMFGQGSAQHLRGQVEARAGTSRRERMSFRRR